LRIRQGSRLDNTFLIDALIGQYISNRCTVEINCMLCVTKNIHVSEKEDTINYGTTISYLKKQSVKQ